MFNELTLVFAQFHFIRPLLLLAIVPCILLLAWLRFEKTAQGDWHKLIPEHLLKHLVHEQRGSSSNAAITLLALLWFMCIIALAGPSWQKIPQPVFQKLEARVYVLDLSYSMYAGDVKPDRITRARLKLIDFLKHKKEGLSALVVVSGSAHVVTPLTTDVNTIISLVPSLEPRMMPHIGSAASDGIRKALELLGNTQIESGKIIFLGDEITKIEQSKISSLMNGKPFSLSILGIGTQQGAPIKQSNGQFLKDQNGSIVLPQLNRNELISLAQSTGGKYMDLQTDDRDINVLLDDDVLDDNAIENERAFNVWFEAGQWLMFPILLLSALAFRRGWILAVVFMVGLSTPTPELMAQEPGLPEQTNENSMLDNIKQLFQNPDQRGLSLLKQQRYQEAADAFHDPEWKAVAQFFSGQFAEASESFSINEQSSKLKKAESWYNKGTALTFAGDYEGAISAFNNALALNPDHEDAKHNKAIAVKLKALPPEDNQQQDQQQKQSSDSSQSSEAQKSKDKQSQDNQSQDEQSDQNQNDQQSESQPSEESSSEQTEQDKTQERNDSENEQQEQNPEENDQEADEPKEQQEQQSQEQAQESEEQSSVQEQTLSPEEREQQQALEQWLRQVPDDPSGLMRRKFELENRRSKQQDTEQQYW